MPLNSTPENRSTNLLDTFRLKVSTLALTLTLSLPASAQPPTVDKHQSTTHEQAAKVIKPAKIAKNRSEVIEAVGDKHSKNLSEIIIQDLIGIDCQKISIMAPYLSTMVAHKELNKVSLEQIRAFGPANVATLVIFEYAYLSNLSPDLIHAIGGEYISGAPRYVWLALAHLQAKNVEGLQGPYLTDLPKDSLLALQRRNITKGKPEETRKIIGDIAYYRLGEKDREAAHALPTEILKSMGKAIGYMYDTTLKSLSKLSPAQIQAFQPRRVATLTYWEIDYLANLDPEVINIVGAKNIDGSPGYVWQALAKLKPHNLRGLNGREIVNSSEEELLNLRNRNN